MTFPPKAPRFGRAFKWILAVGALVLICVLYVVFMRVDSENKPTDPLVVPEVLHGAYTHRTPTVLLTYTDETQTAIKNAHLLAQRAFGTGFDTVHLYRQGHLDPTFYAKHKDILEGSRQSSDCLWKPYFILRTMECSPDGAVITYADSRMTFAQSMAPLFALLEKTPIVFVDHHSTEGARTSLKKETRDALGIAADDKRLIFKKIWAPFMIFKNTPQTRAFVTEWLATCEAREVLTDEPFDATTQDEVFLRHLPDDALVSLVLAKHPTLATVVSGNELASKFGVTDTQASH